MTAKVVRPAERHTQTGQTSGMVREEAFHSDRTWAGVARTAPKTLSGWHHHGDHESVIYVLAGRIRIECGAGGRTVLEGGPGDFLLIPAHEIHREGKSDRSADRHRARARRSGRSRRQRRRARIARRATSAAARAITPTAPAPSTRGVLSVGALGGAAVPAPKNAVSSAVGTPA